VVTPANGFQELARDPLAFGDLGNLCRLGVAARRQIQQGAQRITGLLGDHPAIYLINSMEYNPRQLATTQAMRADDFPV
jgi:hypothetical protein